MELTTQPKQKIKSFSDMGIIPDNQPFEGRKIPFEDVIDQDIIVHDFKIKPSLFPKKPGDMRLDMQITIDNKLRVTWSGSKILMDQIEKVEEENFPFSTTIIKLNPRGFKFT